MSLQPSNVAGVPILVATPGAGRERPWPAVLWCHGFRADALAHAAELVRCAHAGFLAVGIDAVGHGARRDPGLTQRVAEAGGALPVMRDQVEQTVAELPTLIDALVVEHDVDRAHVSLVGISMGAFLAYRAIAAGLSLRAVVALLGSPAWPTPTRAHRLLERFGEVALLSITAEHDVSVPPAPVVRLHAALDAQLGPSPRRSHQVLAGAGHLTSASEWAQAMAWTLAWLQQHGRADSTAGPTTGSEPVGGTEGRKDGAGPLSLGMSSSPPPAGHPGPVDLSGFPPTSPCIKVCQLDLQDRCYGCGRTRSEIAQWSGMSLDERRAVNARLGFRGHGQHR